MGQNIQVLYAKNFSELLLLVRKEAESIKSFDSRISSITCTAYSHANFSLEINALLICTDGYIDQHFEHVTASNFVNLEIRIQEEAKKMAKRHFELTSIGCSSMPLSITNANFEAILIFTRK